MRFIRFVLTSRDSDSEVAVGIFTIAYKLRDSADVNASDRKLLAETLEWFGKNLDTPARFNRSRSKGFYRRRTRGIAWFKDTATEHLARMHQIKAVLERHGHSVMVVSETRVGYVVYHDEFQIIAEPFSDTQTS